ncbi:MAG: hypothetical protein FD143_474 [Ignavibacteria bacterium]|nr:MAG: hypothetical protein FD143_474 [Ignavibacteria bacterium]KAF0161545.1 MAG: hypothetical protein FD188_662 [Ignavibacteria bacterium]
MWFGIIIIVAVIIFLYEYRLRKPDQLVLKESDGKIVLNKTRFYPKDFCLVLPKTTLPLQLNVESTAKGNLDIKVKLAVTVSLAAGNVSQLIKVGGWNSNSVTKAAKEFEVVLQSLVKEFTVKYEIEELSSEKIYHYLIERVSVSKEQFGLDVISVSVQSFEVVDQKIAESIRQQESARILEQTELLNQKARITAAKAKLKADEEIAFLENELELKKFDLRRTELDKESELADKRIKEELKRKKLNLEFEKEELEMLKNNPELLLLSPQAARLAEASQSLKNARTVVNLSPSDIAQGSDLLNVFQNFLLKTVSGSSKNEEKK